MLALAWLWECGCRFSGLARPSRGVGRAGDRKRAERLLPSGSSSAAKLACGLALDTVTIWRTGVPSQGRGGADGGIRREAHASGSEHRRQPMRRSTHTGFRPAECESTASAGSATPAPSESAPWPSHTDSCRGSMMMAPTGGDLTHSSPPVPKRCAPADAPHAPHVGGAIRPRDAR